MGRFRWLESGAPKRFSPIQARLLIGLSLFILLIAMFGMFLYDGWQRVAYVTTFTSMGLGNLATGVGSLLPEERGGRHLRTAAYPFIAVMLITLPIALAFDLVGG